MSETPGDRVAEVARRYLRANSLDRARELFKAELDRDPALRDAVIDFYLSTLPRGNGRPRAIAAELEERIVGMRRQGMSYESIAAKLTADGIPSPTGRPRWGWTTVARVVRRAGSQQ